MIGLKETLNELVIANRILANEDVVDAYGHVSVRHPENPQRFFMAHMLTPPEVVEHQRVRAYMQRCAQPVCVRTQQRRRQR